MTVNRDRGLWLCALAMCRGCVPLTYVVQRRAFMLLCRRTDTVARVRAHLMHILHGMDRHRAPFHLRHRGIILKNSLMLEVCVIALSCTICLALCVCCVRASRVRIRCVW